MLEIKNLRAQVGEKEILRGIDLTVGARRSSRHHGTQRFGQEHASACSVRAGKLPGDGRRGDLRRQRSFGHEPGREGAGRYFLGLSVSR